MDPLYAADKVPLGTEHYENFPVASILLPKKIRRAITDIYIFARTADDIADEGNMPEDSRLKKLDFYAEQLYLIANNIQPSYPLFANLFDTINIFNLPIELFHDLLFAFKQDVIKNRYDNFNELLYYCHYSANPIGRLLLILTNCASLENCLLSDKICTGLQLINFWQDIESDLQLRNRCYLPLDEMQVLQITPEDILLHKNISQSEYLLSTLLSRTASIYAEGIKLQHQVPGRMGFEIGMMIAGGKLILQTLQQRDSIYKRPILSKFDFIRIFFSTFYTLMLKDKFL